MKEKKEEGHDGDRGSEALRQAIGTLLGELGEDPLREGLQNTPARVAKSLRYLTRGYRQSAEKILNNALYTVPHDEMVIIKDIDFFSLCEHHLLPFFGKCHIAYLPNRKVIGLSKIPRLVEMYSRRLQIQERLTSEIAHAIEENISPLGVAVVMEARHMCMVMRGVEKINSVATTSAMLGGFRSHTATRMEFLTLIQSSLIK